MLIGDEDGIEATQALCFDAAWASLASLTKARYAARLFSSLFTSLANALASLSSSTRALLLTVP